MVSGDDARAFCAWLSKQEDEKKAGRAYALPTEAQWEWATRAGTATPRYFGETDKEQAKFSWFNATYTPNPKHETEGRGRQPVGKLPANAWGLHDTLGNVWEWCGDRRADEPTSRPGRPATRSCGAGRGGRGRSTAPPSPTTPARRGRRATTSGSASFAPSRQGSNNPRPE